MGLGTYENTYKTIICIEKLDFHVVSAHFQLGQFGPRSDSQVFRNFRPQNNYVLHELGRHFVFDALPNQPYAHLAWMAAYWSPRKG